MGSLKIEKLGGQLPSWDDRNLPEDQASLCQNAYLYSGALIGWRQPKFLRTLLNSAAKFAYRIPTITSSIALANLLFFGNPNVGDQVTVGEVTYTFVTTPANPNDVAIGSTADLTQQALFAALNFGASDITIVGPGTTPNPAVAAQNPYLGFPSAFTSETNTPGANTIVLIPVTPTGTMKINSINLTPRATIGGAKFKGVIYQNVSQINLLGTAYTNIPSALVITGNEVVGCVSGAPVSSALSIPITLEAGQTYWIGFIMDTAIPLQLASLGTIGVSNANVYASGPPNPFQTTELSGVTTGGTTTGALLTPFNLAQPNWQFWGAMSTLTATDALNTFGQALIGEFFDYIQIQAPAYGAAYNLTPVSESTGRTRMTWLSDLLSLNDVTSTLQGGTNQTSDTTMTGASQWLEFVDQDTNVLRTPVVDDSFQRFYFASPSEPPQYNTYARLAAGQPPFILGIPAPGNAPTLSIVGGGNPTKIGFPTSTTSQTYSLDPTLSYLAVFPVMSSVEVTINSVSVNLASGFGGSGVYSSNNSNNSLNAFVFANAAVPADGTPAPFAPGDVIADSGYPTGNGLIGPNGSGVTMLANTQYWIGIIVIGFYNFTPNVYSLADLNAAGYVSAPYPITPGSTSPGTFPQTINPLTQAVEAPPVFPGFPDLQIWANTVPGPAGEAQLETRAYVYTWVSEYGEEGPPSPPLLLDGYDNATWRVGMYTPLPLDMGTDRNITKTNIYRTMASQQGGTVFFLVTSVAATVKSYDDIITDNIVALNTQLPSTNWFPPPADLLGLVTMPNGMIAGWRGNEVWLCEPFRPHAWPAGYVMTTDFPIVGLGVSGSSLVAATDTNPNVFTGVNPSVMSQARIPHPAPCTSRGGILATDRGVYYPTQNGLMLITAPATAVNVTQGWISREHWEGLTPQKFLRASKNGTSYFAFGTTGVTNGQSDTSVAQQGFTIELSEADRESFTIYPQVGGHRIGFNRLTAPNGVNVDNVLTDPWSGVTYILAGGNVYYYDFTDQAPLITVAKWRSKKFQGMHKDNFSAFRVWFDVPPGGPQQPPTVRTEVNPSNTSTPALAYVPGMFGVVRVLGDGKYVTERELRFSTELMRIVSDQKYTTWQFEFEGIVSITNLKAATSVKELGLIK